ncbi:MAG: 6-phosphogluconolactonase [Anaerolineae bacterium]|nr:6-phosphogluconolactonase [Anaerolineae bacterium]
MPDPDIRIYDTLSVAARSLAEQIVEISERAITARGRFTIALSGGETPRILYRLLATDEFAPRIEFAAWHAFFGDERCVPPDDADSNYHMARLSFLDHVPIPLSNIYRMHGEVEPELAAKAYDDLLRDFFTRRGENRPRFDLVLLGMGADGHTASLFHGSPALTTEDRWVLAPYVEALGAHRMTLTANAINAAARVFFLVGGSAKAEALARALKPSSSPDEALPVQSIHPEGELRWYVDRNAARSLRPPQEL